MSLPNSDGTPAETRPFREEKAQQGCKLALQNSYVHHLDPTSIAELEERRVNNLLLIISIPWWRGY
jgi:hypothetical protein